MRSLGLKELRRRAKVAGMSASELEEAMDSDEPEEMFIDFVVQVRVQADKTDAACTSLEVELGTLRLSELRKRAKAAGVAEDALEEATDADDPKAAVISLLLETASAGEDKPHFGSARAAAAKASVSVPAPAPAIATKHVMLSYQWDHQAQVMRVYDMLTRLGVPCWMDVKSGMGGDIYEGMANAVSNACVVVCFMSEKYQQSANCMLEVKFAKQSG
eukprot:COSAG02_NODE_12180_length_1583_cov_736.616577_1_plen_216_part_10